MINGVKLEIFLHQDRTCGSSFLVTFSLWMVKEAILTDRVNTKLTKLSRKFALLLLLCCMSTTHDKSV